MKTLLTIALTFPLTAWAADMVISIPSADVPRVQEAFGSIYVLGHNATQAEMEQITKQWMINQIKEYERRKFSPPQLEMQRSPVPLPAAKAAPSPTATPKSKKK